MLSRFDPDRGSEFKGEFTEVLVLDPASPGQNPNYVLNPAKEAHVKVSWKLEGRLVPLYVRALEDPWVIKLFAETMGPGDDLYIATSQVEKGDPAQQKTYETTLVIPPYTLKEGNPTSNNSGVYKLVITAFLDSRLGTPGFDISGFTEGPLIRVENPL